MTEPDTCADEAHPTPDLLRRLETARTQALVTQDMVVAERLHAPDYQLITPTGRTFDKAGYLAAVAAGPFYSGWEIGPLDVRLSPRMAIVRYRARLGFPSGTVIDCWHTDSWELRDGQWQAVWSQATQLQAPRSTAKVPGTQGYAEQADELIPRYEAQAFEHKHRAELHLLPAAPARVLDVGAGTGADAAWLAAQGHEVVAVEPTARLREAAMALHPDPSIRWIDDSLPGLAVVRALGERFDAILLTAVWMHLDAFDRDEAMARLAALLAPDGILMMSLRHGPLPEGRRMFDVSGAETIERARRQGLRCVLDVETESTQEANLAAGITWTRLAFRSAR